MKLLFLLIFIPFVSYCQISISPGAELIARLKLDETIKPVYGSNMMGATLQLRKRMERSRFEFHLLSGFSWVKSTSFSNVHSVPILIGSDFNFSKKSDSGISAEIGTRALFADGLQTSYPFEIRAGLYFWGWGNSVQIKTGLQRTGYNNLLYMQIVFGGFLLSKMKKVPEPG